jgi:hypothetical protein
MSSLQRVRPLQLSDSLRSQSDVTAAHNDVDAVLRTQSESHVAPPPQRASSNGVRSSGSFIRLADSLHARHLAVEALQHNAAAPVTTAKDTRQQQHNEMRTTRKSAIPSRHWAALSSRYSSVAEQLEMRRRADNALKYTAAALDNDTLRYYEYFAVCGVPTATNDIDGASAQLLYAFPRDAAATRVDASLTRFCFPSGLTLRRVASDDEAASSLQRSADVMYDAAHSYIFTLSEAREGGVIRTLYGTCVLQDVFADETLTWHTASSAIGNTSRTNRLLTTRAFCFVSRFPYFSLFFQLLYAIVRHEHDSYAAQRRITQQLPVAAAPRSPTKTLRRTLKQLYAANVPDANAQLLLDMRYYDTTLRFTCPPSAECGERYIVVGACVPALLRTLSVDNVLALLNVVLLEQSLLVIGASAGMVSACVLALQALLHPFVWEGVIVPLLPRVLDAYLEAPTPFIIGSVSALPSEQCGDELTATCERYDVAVCALDTDRVVLPARLRNRQLPTLPMVSKLREALAPYFNAAASKPTQSTQTAAVVDTAAEAAPRSFISRFMTNSGNRRRAVSEQCDANAAQRALCSVAADRCAANSRMRVFDGSQSLQLLSLQVSATFDNYYEWLMSNIRALIPYECRGGQCLYDMTRTETQDKVVMALDSAHQAFVRELLETMHWMRLLDEVLPNASFTPRAQQTTSDLFASLRL